MEMIERLKSAIHLRELLVMPIIFPFFCASFIMRENNDIEYCKRWEWRTVWESIEKKVVR